jgi:hypothetical protein
VSLIRDFVLVGRATVDRPALLCPSCGGDCVHPVSVECLPPGAAKGRLVIDAEGIHLDRTVPPAGRGVVITLIFACERGHAFAYWLRFHKGRTFISRQAVDIPKGEFPQTLWRA